MAAARSAGILLYRRAGSGIELLLAHPGGPFWRGKDAGAWTIPKGEVAEGEELLAAARREFTEETGVVAQPPFLALAPVKQRGGKWVHAWAAAGDCDPVQACSNTFTLEWPPKSGQLRQFPEIDRVAWLTPASAREKILPSLVPLIDELEQRLAAGR